MQLKTKSYKSFRDEVKNGDVLMYKNSGIIAWIVMKIIGSETYSHAGIVAWWNQRLMVMEAVGKGVIVTPLSYNIEHAHGDVEWYRSVEPISDERRIQMVQFAQQELGKKYAMWKAILLFIGRTLKLDFDKTDKLKRENHLFCSQYVSAIYNSIGIDLKKNLSDRFMAPDDIAASPKLEFQAIIKKM